MADTMKTVEIEPDSETAKIIVEASENPTVLVINGSRFRDKRETGSPAPTENGHW